MRVTDHALVDPARVLFDLLIHLARGGLLDVVLEEHPLALRVLVGEPVEVDVLVVPLVHRADVVELAISDHYAYVGQHLQELRQVVQLLVARVVEEAADVHCVHRLEHERVRRILNMLPTQPYIDYYYVLQLPAQVREVLHEDVIEHCAILPEQPARNHPIRINEVNYWVSILLNFEFKPK